MQDSREKGVGMRDQEPPFQTLTSKVMIMQNKDKNKIILTMYFPVFVLSPFTQYFIFSAAGLRMLKILKSNAKVGIPV